MNILIQVIGILAMLFSVFSFQMNKHKHIMAMQIIATTLFGIHYFLLGAYTGMMLDIVAAVRGIVFYNKDKKWASGKIWIIVFMVCFAIAGAFTWQGAKSLLMIAAMILNTYSFSCTRPKLVRSTILISSPLILIYNIITGSVGGVINEVFVEISSVVGLLRYDCRRHEVKRHEVKNTKS